jgi:FkbM family methyltransferase
MALLPNLVRFYIRSGARGSTRCTFFLARHVRSLQAVPIHINRTQRLFVDLRDGLSHVLVGGSPWQTVPWEVDEQCVMRRLVRKNDVVFDIGAHIGLHMILLAELVGSGGAVHAFEANPRKLAVLQATARHLRNTVIHAIALSDCSARATLFVPEDESMASLRDWTEGRVGAVRQTTCELEPIDLLRSQGVCPAPDFIKCDVEGAELRVFSGARHTLDCPNAPIILYEANFRAARAFGSSVSAATDFLRSLQSAHYSFFHVQEGGRLRPLDTFSEDCDHYNLVAVPESRRSSILSEQETL